MFFKHKVYPLLLFTGETLEKFSEVRNLYIINFSFFNVQHNTLLLVRLALVQSKKEKMVNGHLLYFSRN
jgi:hypothetical protein